VIRRFALLAALVLTCGLSPSPSPSLPPQPQGGEVAFVAGIMKDLNARFPTPADANKAGYFRYTNEDDTGAISYANLQWQSSDPEHPSQLWYSVSGKLLGADFSVLQSNSPKPPQLWGVNAARWVDFHAHIHYVLVDSNGKETYGGAHLKDFVAAGGDPNDPSAATLVKMGKAKDVASVKHVFLFPHIWDLIVWVTPNPAGAFADKNPLVKPSSNAQTGD
jgi:hypothetical protein